VDRRLVLPGADLCGTKAIRLPGPTCRLITARRVGTAFYHGLLAPNATRNTRMTMFQRRSS
jgi:hypothetical protein